MSKESAKMFALTFYHFFYFSSSRSQLPARATRLLNRRLQNNNNSPLSLNGSDSPRSLDSLHSRNTPSKTSLREHLKQRQQLNLQSQLINSSSEDLVVDKTLRNSMLQDVVCFKKQLVHLRRILQEVSRSFVVSTLCHFHTVTELTHILQFLFCFLINKFFFFFGFVPFVFVMFSLHDFVHTFATKNSRRTKIIWWGYVVAILFMFACLFSLLSFD